MAYTKTNWVAPAGTNLNRFTKQNETPTSVDLVHNPNLSNTPTPFSIENMENLEQGVVNAHQLIEDNFNTLNSHPDCVENGRNLLTVLGVATIGAAMAALRTLCNGTGTSNFSKLRVGDYIDGLNLSAIPAENAGDAGQAWNATYKNNRIVIAGFNSYKSAGDTEFTKNHILFVFRNIPLKKRMNPTNTNIGGYAASELRAFLEGLNGDGTGDFSESVTTGAFKSALDAQLGAGYVQTFRRMTSDKPSGEGTRSWKTFSVFLPSEHEIFGVTNWGDMQLDDGLKIWIPLYQKSSLYRVKRYNGSRTFYWLGTPVAASAASFAYVTNSGTTGYTLSASSVGGCAPAFCVA